MKPLPRRRDAGVTLVEAAIVLMVIAVASLFAVPVFQSRQIRGNEAEARRMLREIVEAEGLFRTQNRGRTFGLLPELLGDALRRDVVVDPRTLKDPGLRRQEAGFQHKGYLFSVHLPGVRSGEGPSRAVDAAKAGVSWIAYAWPVNAGYSGRFLYVVDETGVVRQTANERGRPFEGVERPPPANLAPHPTSAFGEQPLLFKNLTFETAPSP